MVHSFNGYVGNFRLNALPPTPRRQPQCGVYMLYVYFSFIVCKFGEYQPPETARIARLTARWGQGIIF